MRFVFVSVFGLLASGCLMGGPEEDDPNATKFTLAVQAALQNETDEGRTTSLFEARRLAREGLVELNADCPAVADLVVGAASFQERPARYAVPGSVPV